MKFKIYVIGLLVIGGLIAFQNCGYTTSSDDTSLTPARLFAWDFSNTQGICLEKFISPQVGWETTPNADSCPIVSLIGVCREEIAGVPTAHFYYPANLVQSGLTRDQFIQQEQGNCKGTWETAP